MFQLIFTDSNQRRVTWSREPEPSWRNHFDLEFIRKSIGNNFKIYDGRDTVASLEILRKLNMIDHTSCFVFELYDEETALWAKLSQSSILKNIDRYGIRYEGSIGPFTNSTLAEVDKMRIGLDHFYNITSAYNHPEWYIRRIEPRADFNRVFEEAPKRAERLKGFDCYDELSKVISSSDEMSNLISKVEDNMKELSETLENHSTKIRTQYLKYRDDIFKKISELMNLDFIKH